MRGAATMHKKDFFPFWLYSPSMDLDRLTYRRFSSLDE
jgi:hypothetical protein